MTGSLSLEELHGAVLTANLGDGREPIAGFECDDWPECDTCGDLDKSLVSDEQQDGRNERFIQ